MARNKIELIITAEGAKAAKEVEKLGSSFRLTRSELDGLVKSAAGLGTLYAIGRGISASLDASERMQNSLRGLASVARYAGEDLGQTMQAASRLTADGLLDIGSAATSLKNLLSRGFNLEESVRIAERLKDAAAFGRQGSLSIAEAVQSASEGLKNENSILVDNAGVTKNVSVMWKEYAAQIGKAVTELSMAEKRQAELNGLLRETEGQLGNAKLAAEGLTGAKAEMRQEVFELSAGFGDVLTPVVLGLARAMNWTLENVIRPFVGGIEILGAKASRNVMKIGALADWVMGGFKGGPAAVKEEFRRLDAVFEEQAAEIGRKWEGGIVVPEIGKDSGRRRQDVNGPGKDDGAKKAAEAAKKLAEEWKATRAELTLDVAKLGMDEFEQRIIDLAVRAQQLRDKFGPSELINNWLAQQIEAIDAERLKQAAEETARLVEETQKLAEVQRAGRESAIRAQLAQIDLVERERSISREDAARARLDLQRELLVLQQQHLEQLDKLADPAGWYAQLDAITATRSALVDLEDEMQRLTGTLAEGMGRGFRDVTESAATMFENGQQLAGDAAQGAMDALDAGLFDAMKGRLQSAEDYWILFSDVILRSFSQILSQQAVVGILNMLGLAKEQNTAADATAVGTTAALSGALAAQTGVVSTLTAAYWALAAAKAAAGASGAGAGAGASGAATAPTVVAHTGGLILHEGGPVRLVPRFHSGGLAADEVPAILQTGERVLSRQQNRIFEKLGTLLERADGGGSSAGPTVVNHWSIQAMDARSFHGYLQQNKESVAAALSTARADNHPSRRGR